MQVGLIGVPLCHAADELKRAKGIITAAGEGAKNGAIFGRYRFGNGGIILFGAGGGAVGTDEKGFFALGQVLGGVMDHGIVEFGVIDAGGEADAGILRAAMRLVTSMRSISAASAMVSRTLRVLPWWRE